MQKTAYEMRISDWSSDVCSSDLDPCLCHAPLHLCGYIHELMTFGSSYRKNLHHTLLPGPDFRGGIHKTSTRASFFLPSSVAQAQKIGRASCRERVCQYV